jgi:hypothetical protein
MAAPSSQSFSAFYVVYLKMHNQPTCRRLHVVGNLLALVPLPVALVSRVAWWLLLMPVIANAFAWVGHIFFQKNRPGVLRYPLGASLGSWRMTWEVLTGRLPW